MAHENWDNVHQLLLTDRSINGSADISGWYDGKKRLAHIMHIE